MRTFCVLAVRSDLPAHAVSLAGAIGRPRLSVTCLNRPRCSSPPMSALQRITDLSRIASRVRKVHKYATLRCISR
jgi:hypothetical protein